MNLLSESQLQELEEEIFHDEFSFLLRFYEMTYPEFSSEIYKSWEYPMSVGLGLYSRLWVRYENLRYLNKHSKWNIGFDVAGPTLDASLPKLGYVIHEIC